MLSIVLFITYVFAFLVLRLKKQLLPLDNPGGQVGFHDLDIRTTGFWRIWFSLTLFIFCSPLELRAQSVAPLLVCAGDIATCDGDKSEETAKLIDKIEGRVVTVGRSCVRKGKGK